MPAIRRVLTVIAVAALGLFAVACNGDDGINDNPNSPVQSEPEKVKIEQTDAGFNAAGVYHETVPGVISVRSLFGSTDDPLDAQVAGGSGFVLSDKGEIVTNAHVITNGEGEDRKPADQVFIEFYDGNILPAEIIGFDPFADVGLVKVDPDAVKLTPLAVADSERVVVGQPIAVIGSPFGEDHSLSTGVVSQTGRSVMSLTDFQIEGAIQTDASINPGNSGGPMLNGQGEVIGISQQMKSGSGASNGVGFGVPSNTIKNSVEQLREHGEASYAYIGVSTQPVYPQLAEKLGLGVDYGAMVAEVVKGGPADKAGLEGADDKIIFQADRFDIGGDVIISANGEPIKKAEELGRIIGGLRPGDPVELGIIRGGKKRTVSVDLEERPTALTRPQP